MRSDRRLGLGLGLAALLATGAAFGEASFPECTRKPSSSELEGAKGAHRAAAQFYERADYDRAVQYWSDAYSLDCTAHGVLINIANAHEKRGDRQAAVHALETYLARAPSSAETTTISDKVANLKASLKPSQPPPGPVDPVDPTDPGETTPGPAVLPPAPDTTPTAGPRPYGMLPWVPVGAGTILAVVGVVVLPGGLAKIADAEKVCPNRQCPQTNPEAEAAAAQEGNSGRSQATVGGVLLGVGVLGMAGGLVWQFMYNKPRPAAAAGWQLVPSVAPGYQGVSLGGSF